MTKIQRLYDEFGQSIWLDNINRKLLSDGGLQGFIELGVKGVTSNPSIFQKAIEDSNDYDQEFNSLHSKGLATEQIYWQLVEEDITKAADTLRPVYDSSRGTDGFVSIEVDPRLANDSQRTLVQARALRQQVNRPNVMIKIPATDQGLVAIKQAISEGININITLIFGLKRYLEVVEAYMSGLEQFSGDKSSVHSVASFFISRIDSLIDAQLEKQNDSKLAGLSATAQAQVAYGKFLELFGSPRWKALADQGSQLQRLLWASTSTKNPNYPDTKYLDSLIASNTVNTAPDKTILLFEEHGRFDSIIDDASARRAQVIITQLEAAGVNFDTVSHQLEQEGAKQFVEAFEGVLGALDSKRE